MVELSDTKCKYCGFSAGLSWLKDKKELACSICAVERMEALEESLKKIIDSGCIEGEIYCRYCSACLEVDRPHDKDCIYIEAKKLLGESE